MLKAHIGPTIGLCTNHFSQPQHQLLKFCKFAPAPRDVIFTNSCASRRRECGDAAPECQVTEGDSSNEECSDPPVRAMTQIVMALCVRMLKQLAPQRRQHWPLLHPSPIATVSRPQILCRHITKNCARVAP